MPIPKLPPPTSAYIHIPFCKAKCFYCDFNSYPGQESMFDDFTDAIISEILNAQATGLPLETVYFGGGTPTSLTVDSIAAILTALVEHFGVSEGAEVTIECNPGTVDAKSLSGLRKAGFNRLSIGIQSFDDRILKSLGRIHTAEDAEMAFRWAREAEFSNISVDAMYALPDQTPDDWRATLKRAVALDPDHISLYELGVEEGTVFGNLRSRCMLHLPDEDIQIEMYRDAISALTSAGFDHYEISNFAKPGRRSRHNQVYWRNEQYYGFGAGATGYVDGVRYTNTAKPADYIRQIKSVGRAIESEETPTGRLSMGETVMLGLRMLDGLDLSSFEARYGVSLLDEYKPEVEAMLGQGLVEIIGDHFRLSSKGLLVANEVAAEFV